MSQGPPSSPSGCPRWLRESGKLTAAGAAGFGLAFLVSGGDNPPPKNHTTAVPLAVQKSVPQTGTGKALPAHLAAASRTAEALELARANPGELRRRIEATEDPKERQLLIRGLFAHLADSLSPRDAIGQAILFKGVDQDTALRELAAVWMGAGPESITGGSRDGSVVLQGGLALIRSDEARPGAAEAWVEAFKNHPARLGLVSAFAEKMVGADPAKALALAEGFTPWERHQFFDGVLDAWAIYDPGAARQWLANPANAPDASGQTFPWASLGYTHPDWVEAALATESDPGTRLDIVRGMAAYKAGTGTREALAWADSLTNPAERDAAHDRIFEATPRGIGAVLTSADGYPLVRNVLPDSASARAGLQPGDRFVEVTGGDGKPVSLYQQPLETAVNHLRGEAGESVTLRILRDGPGGIPAEQTIRITRDQLIFPADTAKK